MHAYWVKFERQPQASVLNLGVGVTAVDWSDAEALMRERVFPVLGSATVAEITQDVDIETLDGRHVRPNMGDPMRRGVWFPVVEADRWRSASAPEGKNIDHHATGKGATQ